MIGSTVARKQDGDYPQACRIQERADYCSAKHHYHIQPSEAQLDLARVQGAMLDLVMSPCIQFGSARQQIQNRSKSDLIRLTSTGSLGNRDPDKSVGVAS